MACSPGYFRCDQDDAGEIGRVTPCVPGQNRIPRHSRVRTDKKITEDITLATPLPAVAHKRLAGEKQGRTRNFDHDQAQLIEGLIQCFHSRERQRQFGVDDRIDRQPMYPGLSAQLADRPARWYRPAAFSPRRATAPSGRRSANLRQPCRERHQNGRACHLGGRPPCGSPHRHRD